MQYAFAKFVSLSILNGLLLVFKQIPNIVNYKLYFWLILLALDPLWTNIWQIQKCYFKCMSFKLKI